MTSIAYTDARLAACYDALNPPGPDDAFYRRLAGAIPRRILDMGCGTGRLAAELAAMGHEVTGIDPAPGMLAVARSREGTARVTWIEGTADALPDALRFDLAIMTGHAFQAVTADAAIAGLLAAVRRHLAPGGRFAFETRNPLVREWETWTPEETRERVEVPGLGPVEVEYAVTGVEGPLVTYETRFRFAPLDRAVATDILRFMDAAELEGFLRGAGFERAEWFGDWDESPLGPTRPEIIAIAGVG